MGGGWRRRVSTLKVHAVQRRGGGDGSGAAAGRRTPAGRHARLAACRRHVGRRWPDRGGRRGRAGRRPSPYGRVWGVERREGKGRHAATGAATGAAAVGSVVEDGVWIVGPRRQWRDGQARPAGGGGGLSLPPGRCLGRGARRRGGPARRACRPNKSPASPLQKPPPAPPPPMPRRQRPPPPPTCHDRHRPSGGRCGERCRRPARRRPPTRAAGWSGRQRRGAWRAAALRASRRRQHSSQ